MTNQLDTKPAPARTANAVSCQSCHAQIGVLVPVEVDGKARVHIKIGAVILSNAYGRCECGAAWRYVDTDQLFERMMTRRKVGA